MKHQYLATGMLAVVLATAAQAQTKTVEQRLEELEQEIRVLKRQRELEQEAAVQEAERVKKLPVIQADSNGFAFKSGDGSFSLRLGGQIKADGNFFLDDRADSFADTFTISSARPIISGTLFKSFDYTLSADFGGSSAQLVDAFLEWKEWPALKLRAGRYKHPVGLERLQSDVNNLFTSLALPSQLVPGRDVGFQVGGDLFDGVLNYSASVINGTTDGGSNNGDNSDGKDAAARVMVHPFKKTDIEPLHGLGLGIAGTMGWQDSPVNGASNLAGYRTSGGNTFFSYATGAFASGDRTRIVPQAYYYWKRLGLMAEYAQSEHEVQLGADETKLRHNGWQVTASFLLTDDVASYRGVNPKKPFSLKNKQWGAWEIVGRIHQLDVDDDAFPTFANPLTSATKASAFGLGLNWYLNRNVRWFLDYDQTSFDGGGGTPDLDREDEHLLSTRFQLTF